MTAKELVERLEQYIRTGQLDPSTPIEVALRRLVGRQVRPVGSFASIGIELRFPEKKAALVVTAPGLFHKK